MFSVAGARCRFFSVDTAGFLIYGRHAVNFCQIVDQNFDQGLGDRKYSVQFYWDGEIQFYSTCLILTVEIFNPNSRDH